MKQHNLEIPVGKRTFAYRFLEMLPGIMSYGVVIIMIILSLISPLWASVYLLILILMSLVKIVGISYHVLTGRRAMEAACQVDWRHRLDQLEDPATALQKMADHPSGDFGHRQHMRNLAMIAEHSADYPKPSVIYNAVIMPAYNEEFEVIDPAVQALVDTTCDTSRLIVVFAYEERGGKGIAITAKKLQEKYAHHFHSFHLVRHPKDLPNEVIGKGGNITYAGRYLERYLQKQHISLDQVIVTTMDCDNKPHPAYFDYLTYEYIVHKDRKRLSYQPIALFTNNIWDVPAPMRVIATGNSFWNIISSMRPHALRNFASHAQPMDALVEMDYWSVRTIVEDGHQYWRSYFHFKGDYAVVPLYVPIYQDAVLSQGYIKTLKAQFTQLRRWAYGASDVAYVGVRVFARHRPVPFWPSFARFVRLLDGHVALAYTSVMIAFAAWIPLLVNAEAVRSIPAHQLPTTVSFLQSIAMIGIAVAIFSAFKILPPRPARYKRRRTVGMLLQWVLMPVMAIVYGSLSAYTSQTRLLFGRYLDKFDVTEKTTVEMNDQAKAKAARKRSKGDRGDESSS